MLLPLLLALMPIDATMIDRALATWARSCAAPDTIALCATLTPTPPDRPNERLTVDGVALDCRSEYAEKLSTTRHALTRTPLARGAIATLGRVDLAALRSSDLVRWARVRLAQGDQHFETVLRLADRLPVAKDRIAATVALTDSSAIRRLDAKEKHRQRTELARMRTPLRELLAEAERARAIYEDVGLHAPPSLRIVADLRLGQLALDREQAIAVLGPPRLCTPISDEWATIFHDAYVCPSLDKDTVARDALVRCFDAASDVLAIELLQGCERELARTTFDDRRPMNEIVLEPIASLPR